TTNDDCDDGLICTAEGICIEVVECTTSDDCDDDLICSEGICIQAVECESNADCEGNLICSAEGLCIAECTTNANCEGDFVCSDNKCVECINEALQCSLTGIPQLCADNVWVEQAACDADDGQVCVDGACVCENGAQRCGEMGIPDLCVDGAWVAQTPCAGLTRCVEGECATISSEKTCEEADRCEGTTAYHCLNGTMRTWNCPTSSPFGATNATCIIADADGKAWCANKNPVDYCDYDYEFLGLFNPQASSCRWESGYLNHASCVASGGNDYVIDAYTHSVCLEDADGPYRLLCAGNNVAVEDCDLDCVEDGWATMCLEPACESGSQRCSLTGIPQVCVSEIWVNKPACTGLQTCASGNCVDVPVAGEPCSGATFPEQCSGNVAYYCNNSAKIAAWNCTPNSGKCFESKSGGAVSADCGYPDSACTSEGQVMFYSNQYACQLYSSHRAIIYDVCYMSDGKLYLVEDLVAASVCQNNNRRHCSSSSAIATQSCGSNTCTFDGWDAVCM
ncbi:MAG: hypothetical protein FWC40_05305, partial [Proteobacteria bacterium]|nr:hypothetical protein [Pseudomonadota bacterium]